MNRKIIKQDYKEIYDLPSYVCGAASSVEPQPAPTQETHQCYLVFGLPLTKINYLIAAERERSLTD